MAMAYVGGTAGIISIVGLTSRLSKPLVTYSSFITFHCHIKYWLEFMTSKFGVPHRPQIWDMILTLTGPRCNIYFDSH